LFVDINLIWGLFTNDVQHFMKEWNSNSVRGESKVGVMVSKGRYLQKIVSNWFDFKVFKKYFGSSNLIQNSNESGLRVPYSEIFWGRSFEFFFVCTRKFRGIFFLRLKKNPKKGGGFDPLPEYAPALKKFWLHPWLKGVK